MGIMDESDLQGNSDGDKEDGNEADEVHVIDSTPILSRARSCLVGEACHLGCHSLDGEQTQMTFQVVTKAQYMGGDDL